MSDPAQQAAAGDGTAAAGGRHGRRAVPGRRVDTGRRALAGRRADTAGRADAGLQGGTGRRADVEQGGDDAGRTEPGRRELLGLAALGERRAAHARRRARDSVLPTSRRASFVPSEPLLRAACGPEPVAVAPAPELLPASAAPAPSAPASDAPQRPEALVAPAPQLLPASAPQAPSAPASVVAHAAAPDPSVPETPASAPAVAASPRPLAVLPPEATSAPRASAGAAPVVPLRRRALVAARKSVLVAAAVGLAASTVLPLLGTRGDEAQAEGTRTAYAAAAGQHVTVGSSVTEADAARDAYGATSLVDLATQQRRNATAAVRSDYTGPSTADHLADPPYDTLDRDQVLAVALQYLGTPYVHGGEDPSAFDCSGLITFVYAQFGIELTHYVPAQAAQGRVIPASEAVPGDLVVFDDLSHDGIYAGDGMILDAPRPGGFVDVRPIWTPAHHFVRIDG